MRKLKFRVWDLKEKKFTTIKPGFGDYYLDLDGGLRFQDYDYLKLEEKDKYIIQQFVGLLDKNGKEIYEGDIVKNCLNNDPGDLQYELEEVAFRSGSFMVRDMYIYDYIKDSSKNILDVEIAGNIFETPELKV